MTSYSPALVKLLRNCDSIMVNGTFVYPLPEGFFTKEEIEVLIAAVRCNDIAIGRKEYVDRRIAGTK